MSMRDFTITRTPYSFSYTTDSRVPVPRSGLAGIA